MSVDQREDLRRREEIKKAFFDPVKVDKMSPKQVTAIYLRLKRQGKVG